jgi:hypothetical protein
VGTVEFLINETRVLIAQLNDSINRKSKAALNSTDPASKNLVLKWIESGDTKADRIPMISTSNKDFWKTFGPF